MSRYRQKRRTPITRQEFEKIVQGVQANSEAFRVDSPTQTSLVAILYYSGLRIAEVVGDSGRRWKRLTEKGQQLSQAGQLPENWMEVEGLWEFKRRGELPGIVKEDITEEGETLYLSSDPLKHGKREEPLELDTAWPMVKGIRIQWDHAKPLSRVWPVSQTTARMILRGAAETLYPHAFRASLASNMARDPTMSVSDLMGWFGWARSSTADAYIMAQRSRVKARESIKKMVEK
jgi:integrase